MATAREDDNPYNGLGAGGKFRKKPYRRAQSTPYDRPPTAIRNPSIVGGGAGGAYNGWLRKIVDPAQKLVMSTAHRLFSSVFTKRLTHTPPPPPLTPQPPVSSEEQEAKEKQKEALSMEIYEEQETKNKRGQDSEDGCVKDLENILKQKTFTSSEVDHLMALLRERAIDKPVEKEHRASKPVSFNEQRQELTNTMVPDHDTESFRISSKPTNSAVFTEDVGSPTELAKAYMGSRPSKVSPSVLGLRSQAIADNSTALTSLPHLSKSPVLSIVPRPSAHVGSRENGYATPRPRGRSAIYSMARSPYSRGPLTLTPKNSRPLADGLDGSSPATQQWDGSGSSASKAVKRSSSVFESDIGSSASARRLRQKPNLSYQKNWLIPVSGSGVTSSTDYQPSTSARKMLTLSGRNRTFTEQPPRSENQVPPVSSKSSEMASRILQQLDTIVSPPKERQSVLKLATVREKAPAMMSPSKLQGQALKSLEHIDSSKFLEFNNKQDGSVGTSQQNSTDATSEKKGSAQNGLSNTFAGSDKLSSPVNSLDHRAVQKDSLSRERSEAYNLTNSLGNPPMQKKRTFKMSAHEDYIDMEDDNYCNGVAAPKIDGKAKQNTFVPDHSLRVDQATVVEKPSSIFYGKLAISSVKESASKDVNAEQVVADKPVAFSFSSAISSSGPAGFAMTQSTSTVEKSAPKESNPAFPAISFGDKVSSLKDRDALKSPFGFVANNGSVASNANEAEAKPKQSASSLDSKPLNLTSFASAGTSPFIFETKAQESAKAEDNTASQDGVAKGAPEPASAPALSTSSAASFSFGIAPAAKSSNGSIASSPVTFGSTSQKPPSSSPFPVTFGGSTINTVPSTNTVAATPSTTQNAEQSTPAAPAFKFGVPTTAPASAAPFTSSAAPSTSFSTNVGGSSVISPVFGFNAATAITSSAQESVSTSAANGPSAQVSESPANKTGISALTQSAPVQFGTSAASSFASSNSIFASSSAAKLFPSASSFGSSTAASSVANTSSLGSTMPVFGGSTFKALSGGGFSFGGNTSSVTTGSTTSSTSAPTVGSTGTTPFLFGSTGSSSSSTGAASTFGLMTGSAAGTSPFGSMGTSTSTVAAPTFGLNGTSANSSTGALAFGSSAASSSAPSSVFGFTSGSTFPFTSAAPKASSSPTFGFGATAAPGNSSSAPAFQFGAATPANNMSPQPSFPSSSSVFGFGSSTPATNGSNNNDQMNMEDTMAEDSVQQASASLSPAPVFGQQQPISSSPVGFAFGAGVGGANPNPFQFGTPPQQQQQQTTQNPFQASGSLDFNASGGGSFSLGTGGGDKSGRKFVKVRKSQRRK